MKHRGLVILLATAGAVGVALLLAWGNSGPGDINWDGITVSLPLSKAEFYNESGLMLAVASEPQDVIAGISGKVVGVTDRSVEIENGPITMKYRGMMTVQGQGKDKVRLIKFGDEVRKGKTVIGKLEMGKPDPYVAELRVQLIFGVKPEAAPFKDRYQSEGQRLYVMLCTGCHRVFGVVALSGGKLNDGELANEDNLADVIRNGAIGMPPFWQSLGDGEIQAIAHYLCNEVCVKPGQ